MQAPADGLGATAVFERGVDAGEKVVEERCQVLPVLGGQGRQVPDRLFEGGDVFLAHDGAA